MPLGSHSQALLLRQHLLQMVGNAGPRWRNTNRACPEGFGGMDSQAPLTNPGEGGGRGAGGGGGNEHPHRKMKKQRQGEVTALARSCRTSNRWGQALVQGPRARRAVGGALR